MAKPACGGCPTAAARARTPTTTAPAAALRVSVQRVDELFRVSGEVTVHTAALEARMKALAELAESQAKLDHQATYDPLTDVLNRNGLDVLVHPNTLAPLDDHLVHALWLGGKLALKAAVLPARIDADQESPIEPNTTPTLSP